MADETKVVGLTADNAVLLLEAAEKKGLDASVVRTTSQGHFLVPAEVAAEAGLGEVETTKRKTRTARSAGKDED